jgi:hypothetical protein
MLDACLLRLNGKLMKCAKGRKDPIGGAQKSKETHYRPCTDVKGIPLPERRIQGYALAMLGEC